jgi:hypothetical protein
MAQIGATRSPRTARSVPRPWPPFSAHTAVFRRSAYPRSSPQREAIIQVESTASINADSRRRQLGVFSKALLHPPGCAPLISPGPSILVAASASLSDTAAERVHVWRATLELDPTDLERMRATCLPTNTPARDFTFRDQHHFIAAREPQNGPGLILNRAPLKSSFAIARMASRNSRLRRRSWTSLQPVALPGIGALCHHSRSRDRSRSRERASQP